MRTRPAKITLEQVTVAFGERLVVQDVSIVLQEHDLLCIVGTSGSGKTPCSVPSPVCCPCTVAVSSSTAIRSRVPRRGRP